MTRSEAIAQAERAVVDAAVAWRSAGKAFAACVLLGRSREQEVDALSERERELWISVDALLALRAQTCEACGGCGAGDPFRYYADRGYRPTPCAACHGTGRRVSEPRAEGEEA